MLKEIRLYGYLKRLCGQRSFYASVSTAAEAVRFLLSNFPQLEGRFNTGWFTVVAGDRATEEEGLHHPTAADVFKIIPVQTGHGGDVGDFFGSVGSIIAGVVLVAAAVFLGPLGFAAAGLQSAFFGGTVAGMIGSIGASLVLGGVAQLVSPVPSIGSSGSSLAGLPASGTAGGYNSTRGTELDPDEESYNFSGLNNTSKAGVPIPVVLGEMVVGSVTISAGLDTYQMKK
ncbi:MAG TPA: hypothetical protein DHV53_10065 [Gammaproteobacteria bacterium]|nr:hypothetical protein [Gammaproteobacteria bacterium]|tara:strand:- start:404 stop:1090 length:687 start_codon:yes stop_codon:yes gene_type:complete